MRRIGLLTFALILLVAFALPVWAAGVNNPLAQGLPNEMTPQQWQMLKQKFKTGPADDSHCCQPHMPKRLCRSGYQMTGYTHVRNYMVVEAWGNADPKPGGYVAIASRTLVKDGVTCCDEIKGTVCDK